MGGILIANKQQGGTHYVGNPYCSIDTVSLVKEGN